MMENFAQIFFLTLIHATVLALLTWLISASLLRRCRPSIHAAIWTIALIKFFVPPVLPGEMALSSWITRLPTSHYQRSVPVQSNSDISVSIEADRLPNEQQTGGAASIAASKIFLTSIYFIIVAFLILCWFFKWLIARRRIQCFVQADEYLVEEIRALAAQIGLRRLPAIRVTRENISLYVTGFVSPVLVLPESLLRQLKIEARDALILHELAHLLRGDIYVRWLENLARVIFFFWPPLWWVCRRIDRFTEMACDSWAVSVSRVEPHSYARSLLDFIKTLNPTESNASSRLALSSNERILKDRLLQVIERRHTGSPKLSKLFVVALLVWSVFAFAGGAAKDAASAAKPSIAIELHSDDHIEMAREADNKVASPVQQASSSDSRPRRRAGSTASLPASDESVSSKREIEEDAIRKLLSGEMSQDRLDAESRAADRLNRIRELHPEADLDGNGSISPYEEGALLGRLYKERKHGTDNLQGSADSKEQVIESQENKRRLAEEMKAAERSRKSNSGQML
jgi:beta-lactamase regulating signal transducer with metallopeptidase domain